MLFWIGVVVAVIGLVLYVRSHTLAGSWVQRHMNTNPERLQKALDDGEFEEMAEGGKQLIRDAIDYQRENRPGPPPLARRGIALIVMGVLLALGGWLL